MKKFLSLSLAMMLCLGLLAGCGGGEDKVKLAILDTEYITEDYAICLNKDNTALLDEINTALAGLKEDGTVDKIINKYINGVAHDLTFQENLPADAPTLTMGTNATFPPYEYHENEKIVGIDAELASAIADKLGRKLEIKDMEFESIIVAVQTGNVDMGMAGMTVTEERMQSVNFTESYATGVQVVIVKEGGTVTSVDDLFAEGANFKIGVQQNTTGDLYATWDIEDKGLGTVERYNKGSDAVQALIRGQVDCVIIDNEPAKAFVAQNNG
jgi:polar amino acid transport system substrate-binding protein